MRTAGHTPSAERAVGAFSSLGEHGALWIALGLLAAAADRPQRGAWARAAGVVAATYGLNTGLKFAFRRRRPRVDGLPPLVGTPTELSFPSAHAATSFAGAHSYSRAGLWATPLYLLAASLSVSRVYLGLHYPSDVLGGALLGAALGRRVERCFRAR